MHSRASPVQLRHCQENQWRRILQLLCVRPPVMESASSTSLCHLLPSQVLTNTARRLSPTDGSLSSQFKRAVSPFTEEIDRLLQKVETSKTLHPWPAAHSLTRSLARTSSSSYGGQLLGSLQFFFRAPPTCHPVQSRLPLSFAATESLPEALCCVCC